GQEAVSYCTENELPWIVLMDLNMPLMNGFEATRILKQRFPDLPIIVQTAYAMKEDARKAKEAGCDDFISKPLIISKLLGVMLKYNR
ncbi:MAG: response regulator, partial [Bacteroidetes bacterium]|nr:response regulator [Bacteroidota bacterium]